MSTVTRNAIDMAIFLHLFFGFYMFSNSQIFTYSSSFAYLDYLKE